MQREQLTHAAKPSVFKPTAIAASLLMAFGLTSHSSAQTSNNCEFSSPQNSSKVKVFQNKENLSSRVEQFFSIGSGFSGGPALVAYSYTWLAQGFGIKGVIINNCGNLTPTPNSQTGGILALTPGQDGGGGHDASTGYQSTTGGQGGDGGSIGINNLSPSTISVANNNQPAIFAYSHGGDGGNGGSGNWDHGGSNGGLGGNGGSITIFNSGTILNSSASGIRARSEGGAAGSGGGSGWFDSGGSGGAAGNSGREVEVTNSGFVLTYAKASTGITMQSIGGNGGEGGSQTGAFYALGGSGGVGGLGGNITGINNGGIITYGNQSAAMSGLSLGGGGGDGGDAVAVGAFLGVAQGGSAGGGGSSGNVTLTLGGPSGLLQTSGRHSPGLVASAIGGGGGHGGFADAFALGALGSATLSLGGSGGGGGWGGGVNVTDWGGTTITTGYGTAQSSSNAPLGDYSPGILAHSVGGGGGVGGNALSASAAVGSDAAVAIAIGIGGTGGQGGYAGTVSVANAGAIDTFGRGAEGIYASSVGGGGGHGGYTVSAAVSGAELSGSIGVGLGGSGGDGGDGGGVQVYHAGTIGTVSAKSSGIVAQSIGGGGGSGGTVTDIAAAAGKNSLALTVGVGGLGGSGGKGAEVDVTLESGSSVVTGGHKALGILAQSIGGGGGDGGNVNTYAVSLAGGNNSKAISGSVAVGGKGEVGGIGGLVQVAIGGNIQTFGDQSQALLAQSVGGGGGHGGNVMATSLSASMDTQTGQSGRNISASVSVGGGGGNGQIGGAVNVSTIAAGSIHTSGVHSTAIHAQSLGGGGGVGGNAHSFAATDLPISFDPSDGNQQLAVAEATGAKVLQYLGSQGNTKSTSSLSATVSVGGSGGSGGDAGAVSVSHNSIGSITTENHQSHGILAQSIGGGGGFGGEANADGYMGMNTYGLAISVGGSGKAAGNGGSTTVSSEISSGTINTLGDYSHGVFAQSVGGGGGLAGEATSKFYTMPEMAKKSAQIGVGGSAGAAGQGGIVQLSYASDVLTSGHGSSALFAQSIGGGGGSGNTTGGGASGIFGITVGASGVAGGDGGAVTINSSGHLTTLGRAAPAIIGQSVGGGGGHGGVSGAAEKIALSLGGYGGKGGNGDAVAVYLGGSLSTSGAVSPGVIAQSIGGGGGITTATDLTVFQHTIPIVIETAGDQGSGGNVLISDVGSPMRLTTTGEGSHGIVAQSAGAGGGLALLPGDLASRDVSSVLSPAAYSVWANSNSGSVSVNLAGSIQTSGNHADGILAMSRLSSVALLSSSGLVGLFENLLGSSGGNQFDGKGQVSVQLASGASITTTGFASDGIRAIASAGKQGVTVTNGGTISVSGANSWGVHVSNDNPSDSSTNQLALSQTGSIVANGNSAGAINIEEMNGAINVELAGTVLASGRTAIQTANTETAITIQPGAIVYGNIVAVGAASLPLFSSWLGSESSQTLLSNSGSLYGSVTGGPWAYQILSGGTHYLSVDPNGGHFDSLDVSSLNAPNSNAAPPNAILGKILPILTALPNATFTPIRLVHTTEGYGTSFVMGNTLSTQYQYKKAAADIYLSGISVDYTRAGLQGNLGELATFANKQLPTLRAKSALSGVLLNAANATQIADLKSDLTYLDATSHFANTAASMTSSTAHLDSMHSCVDFSAEYAAIAQAECNWVKGTLRTESMRNGSFNQNSQVISVGRQQRVSGDFFAGLSAGYENFSFDSLSGRSNGYRALIGGIAKYQNGPVFGSLSAAFSFGDADAARLVPRATALSEQKTTSLVMRASGGYLFQAEALDIIPRLDIDVGLIYDNGYQERGADDLNIKVHKNSQVLVDAHPAVRLNKSYSTGERSYQAYAEVGARFALNDPKFDISLPNGGSPFERVELISERENVLATVAAGLNITNHKGLQIRLLYEGSFGQGVENHGVSLKAGFEF